MSFKPLLTTLVATTLISACSSDSDSNNDSSEPLNLNIPAYTINDCELEAPATSQDVMVIIHNSDFSAKEFLYPDSSGNIQYQSNSSRATYSILKTDKGRQEAEIRINTFVDAKLESLDYIHVFTTNTLGCSCESTTSIINLPNAGGKNIGRVSGINDYSVPSRSPSGSTSEVSGEYCRNPNEVKIPVSVTIDHWDGQSISYDDDYQINKTLNVDHEGISPDFYVVTADNNEPNLMVARSFTENGSVNVSITPNNQLSDLFSYDFANIIGHRYSIWHDLDLGFEGTKLTTSKSLYTDKILNGESVELTHVLNLSEFDEESFTYNFADDEGFDSAFFTFRMFTPELDFRWNITTPLEGGLPQIDNMTLNNFAGVSDTELSNGDINLDFGVRGYKNLINSYDEFVEVVLNRFSFQDRMKYGAYMSSYLDMPLGNIAELSSTNIKKPLASSIKAAQY